jgi:hypothetical protein
LTNDRGQSGSSRGRWIRLAVAGVLFAGLAGWLLPETGLPIAVGFALAAFALVGWPLFRAALDPLLDLVRAVRPLVLPLIVIVAGGTIESPPLVQLLVTGLAAIVGWRLAIAPERERAWQVLVNAEWTPARFGPKSTYGGTATIGLGLAAVVAFAFLPALDAFEERGGLSTFLFTCAAGLWFAALALRLFGFANTVLRGFVAVLVLLAALRGLMFVGLLPLHEEIRAAGILDPGWFLLVALLATLAAGVLQVAHRRATVDSPGRIAARLSGPDRLHQRTVQQDTRAKVNAVGLGAATLAALTLLGAIVAGKFEFGGETAGARSAMPAKAPSLVTDDAELAETYMPVLAFTEGQRWKPIRVDGYLRQAILIGPHGGEREIDGLSDLRRHCPGLTPIPCYHLTIRCKEGGEPCAQALDPDEIPVGRRIEDGVTYVRVVRADSPPKDGTANVFRDVGPYGEDLSILIQYWFFYYYDDWRRPVLAGELIQQHEADWEAVMVGLSDERPLFVAYSSHCGGSWTSWEKVRVDEELQPGTRPLVAVAEGSQANYPDADQDRAPDWVGCSKKLPRGTAGLVSYASNIRDDTGYAWRWEPQAAIPVDATTPPMSFPGTWGRNERVELKGFFRS